MTGRGDDDLARQMNRWNARIAFATAFVESRTAAGLSRQELAQRSGVPEALIMELEHADRDHLTNEQVAALAAALGTSWEELSARARDRARRMPEDE